MFHLAGTQGALPWPGNNFNRTFECPMKGGNNDVMKAIAIVNEKAGALRGLDSKEFSRHIISRFGENGHEVMIRTVKPEVLHKTIAAAGDSDVDAIIACGGDGTISCAAMTCVDANKYLGVVPGGTMNLFARSLGIPLDPRLAIEALAMGEPGRCDYGTANDRLFLHQYSVGMQPQLVRKRSKYVYSTRIGKIFASVRSTLEMVASPPKFQCSYVAGERHWDGQLSMIAVSNNMHTEGHLPYPDVLDANVLGIYSCPPVSTGAGAKLVSDLLIGNWSTNPDLTIEKAAEVELKFANARRGQKALIDGELIALEKDVLVKSHGGGLQVLKPLQPSEEN